MNTKDIVKFLQRTKSQRISFELNGDATSLAVAATKDGQLFVEHLSLKDLSVVDELAIDVLDCLEHHTGVPIAERIDDVYKRTRPFPKK